MFCDASESSGQIHNYVERDKRKSFLSKSTIVSVNAGKVIGGLVTWFHQNTSDDVVYFQ
jgi:hypothetical protein